MQDKKLLQAAGFDEADAEKFAEAKVTSAVATKIKDLAPVIQATIASFEVEKEFDLVAMELDAHKRKVEMFNRLDAAYWDMVEVDKNMFLNPDYQALHDRLNAYNAELNDKHLRVDRRHMLRERSTELHKLIQTVRQEVMGVIRLDVATALIECEDADVLNGAPPKAVARIKLAEIRQYPEYIELQESE